jgi:hypothetical protein
MLSTAQPSAVRPTRLNDVMKNATIWFSVMLEKKRPTLTEANDNKAAPR